MADYVLSIDAGTTGVTVLLVDARGAVARRAYGELPQHYPRPGWVEHDPEEIAQVAERGVREVVAGLPRGAVAVVGITNQRETTILWERRTGQPVAKAIVWQCRRTAAACDRLKEEGHEPEVRKRTGLVIDAYFSATKIDWLLDNVAGLRPRALVGDVVFGTVDTWLLWRLTGGRVHATDHTNASRTLLYNIHERSWDDKLCALFGVPRLMLPRVMGSSEVYGECSFEPLAGVPIAGVAGDQQAALFGQGCVGPGTLKNTYGTGCFLVQNTGTRAVRSERGLLTTLACDGAGAPCYALEGSVFVAGAAVQWLRDGLGLIASAAETEALARSVPGTAGVYLVPAFVGLGAPYWDPEARGALVGLTRGTGRAHVVRAALEAIAYQTRDVLDAMVADGATGGGELNVDGGATVNDFLMQFQADILDRPLVRPREVAVTGLGAAYLAGLAVRFWKDAAGLASLRSVERRFEPSMTRELREALYAGWRRAVERVGTRT
ncbi:MAG: glycerol kinase GlpK [Planctomycetes bacterium]|nr:glycerol kinase GlpK [Planctomycetota bacterium]